MRILVLGTGNEIMGDDAVGLVAAKELSEHLNSDIDVILTEESGLSLLDFISGYDRVLVLDAIKLGGQVGEILEFNMKDLSCGTASCRHQISLAEVLILGEKLGIDMPEEVKVIAMEIFDPYTISEGLTPGTEESLPMMVQHALSVINEWLDCLPEQPPGETNFFSKDMGLFRN
jgi:hydrogenase maturation protease